MKPRAIPVRPSAVVLPLSAQRLCAQHSHGSRLAARGSGASPARESECVVTLTLVHPHPGAVCVSETPSKNAVTSISLPLDANPCSQTAQPQGTDSAPQPLLRGTTGEAERWSGPEAQARVFPGRRLVQNSLSAAGPRGRVTLRTPSLMRSSLKPCVHSALWPGTRRGWAWAVVSVVSLGQSWSSRREDAALA